MSRLEPELVSGRLARLAGLGGRVSRAQSQGRVLVSR